MVTSAAHPDYDLRLLGPPTVTVDGRDVSLGGPRQIAVLARLMVTPDQVVSMDQLIASVWDGDEPAQPHVTVRSYISNLRRAIEPNRRRRSADSCLVSIPPGYRLAVDPTVVDWVRFQRLVDEGRAQVIGGNFDVAITVVRRALSLWRGDPCAGLPTSEVFETHRVRLTTLHQTAVELLYESLLHTGQHDAVAAAIEAAIEED
ncbi:MAG: BTAD domain-containing putative transcriptional regulator, partial [Actinomycetota bacterium]